MEKSFATAINCIDGRVQVPVVEFVKKEFGVDYVDMITEPGPDKVLSENAVSEVINSIKERVLISVEKHGSKNIIIAGHHDCAANSTTKDEHLKQIAEAVETIKSWGLKADVHGVWVDENWEAALL
jgi:carbonic anhydrase